MRKAPVKARSEVAIAIEAFITHKSIQSESWTADELVVELQAKGLLPKEDE